jgi:hypothetical protein
VPNPRPSWTDGSTTAWSACRVGRALARLKLAGHQPGVDVVTEPQQPLPGVGRQGPVDAEVIWVVDGSSRSAARGRP